MTDSRKRLAILHSAGTPRGVDHYVVVELAQQLAGMGVDIVHLHGTSKFVPADAIFVHVDLSVVPRQVAQFAQRYPIRINALALDIRKSQFVDGLLDGAAPYPAPVIVKSDLNYGGAPERGELGLPGRALRRARRLLTRAPAQLIAAKSDYRIFPDLADVPRGYFAPGMIVQKLMLEKDGDKNLLREYIFLGGQHFENIERSADAIITEDEHVSCLPFVPHPRLLNLRRRLKLDYGKIDYVMIDGEPFVFDANKTLGIGQAPAEGPFMPDFDVMIRAFADEVGRMLMDPDYRTGIFTDERTAHAGTRKRSPLFPRAARTAATA
ncbi:MAG: hypothetical protein IPK75_00475 [Acidobacteria bacterium]|jgi:hypothetical protein|nr:hypothetical protein [Acidobacteriota bacterium]